MGTTREQQRQEAIAGLEILQGKGLHESVLKEFEASGKLHYSERTRVNVAAPPLGALFWIDTDHYEAEIRRFEEKNGTLVYHATLERAEFGTLLDLFFVRQEEEEWEMDRNDLKDGYGFCYVLNLGDLEFSEFCSIAFEVRGDGLVRCQ